MIRPPARLVVLVGLLALVGLVIGIDARRNPVPETFVVATIALIATVIVALVAWWVAGAIRARDQQG